jgi:hypothetical protein
MMLLNRSRSILLVFHRLQLGSHVGLLLLQQRCALFRFSQLFFLAGAVECQDSTARDQAANDDVFLQASQTVRLIAM